jgi:hypothetical protein
MTNDQTPDGPSFVKRILRESKELRARASRRRRRVAERFRRRTAGQDGPLRGVTGTIGNVRIANLIDP